MSQENVKVVRAGLDALSRGDLDAALKEAAPSFELDFSQSRGTQPGVYGRDETRRFWDYFTGTWESSRWEADEFIEVGEHVVAPLTSYHRGRQAIEVKARPVLVWTFQDGKIARITFYQERQEALEAVGLRE